jgi:hypothetical protein
VLTDDERQRYAVITWAFCCGELDDAKDAAEPSVPQKWPVSKRVTVRAHRMMIRR